jgi:hypothetical protein
MNKLQERLLIMTFAFLATIILMRKENLGIFANLPGIVVFLLVVIITMIITSLYEKPAKPNEPRYTIRYFRQTIWTPNRLEEREILQVQEGDISRQLESADKKSIPANCRQPFKRNHFTTNEE